MKYFKFFLLLLVVSTLGLSGCSAVMGLVMSESISKGMEGKAVNFAYAKENIKLGVTTKEDVQKNMGSPVNETENADNTVTWEYKRVKSPSSFSMISDGFKGRYGITDMTQVTVVFSGNVVKAVFGKDAKDGKEVNFSKGKHPGMMLLPNGQQLEVVNYRYKK